MQNTLLYVYATENLPKELRQSKLIPLFCNAMKNLLYVVTIDY